jgi:Na+-transporting methylmalonyl-CoA/oxaloacetate decarboxylase gamma subunit
METNAAECFIFLVIGMGITYLFPKVMKLFMSKESNDLNKHFHEEKHDINSQAEIQANNKKDDKRVIAAITAAIKYHTEG